MRLNTITPLIVALIISSCGPTREGERAERTAEEAAVLGAVQQFFDTMNTKDAVGARAVLDPDGDFLSVRWGDEGQRIVRRSSNADYLAELGTETETYLERMWNAQVLIHGPIAIVWTPYEFLVDGDFSHCGVDAFQLLQTESGWTVTGGTYTVERTGCAESPWGTASR